MLEQYIIERNTAVKSAVGCKKRRLNELQDKQLRKARQGVALWHLLRGGNNHSMCRPQPYIQSHYHAQNSKDQANTSQHENVNTLTAQT